MKKTFLLLALIIFSAFCFSACDNGQTQKQDYTVSFVLTCETADEVGRSCQIPCLYGGRDRVDTITVKNGEKISDLDDVVCTVENFYFECWRWNGKVVSSETVFSEEFFGTEHNITLQVFCSNGWTDEFV